MNKNALLNHTEKCLLHLLRNPPDSTPSRLWQRDVKVAAAKLGYEFEDITPAKNLRANIGKI